MIYLDHAATTPVRRSALEAMWPYLTGEFGNPSSTHGLGKAAADGLSRARAAVAKVLGGRASEVTFTAGGTEADNLALKGFALGRPRGKHLVTTPIEHDAVLASAEYLQHVHGFEVDYLTPSAEGLIDPDGLLDLRVGHHRRRRGLKPLRAQKLHRDRAGTVLVFSCGGAGGRHDD